MQVIIGAAAGIVLGVAFKTDPWLLGLSNADPGMLGKVVIQMLVALAVPLILFAIMDAW